jgi:glycosyltransferase involved in cell wall biosynthesis
MKIHVMHLVSTFQIKTDTKWLIRLLAKMNRQEFDLTMGAFYDDGEARKAFEAMGIETFCLDVPKVWDVRSVSRLMGRIKAHQPDIVHTHLLRADLLGGLTGKLMGKRVISSMYAYGEYRRAHRRRCADWFLDRASTRWADHFIAVCETIREDLVKRVGIANRKISVIQTGMDALELDEAAVEKRRRELRIEAGERVVLVAARLSYEKGVDCFLRAVGKLAEREVEARFLVAGSGPMEEELKGLAAELGISDRVDFLGFAADVEVLMGLADVVVMPSLAEGLPNVAIETFAVGRPLVASRVGGLVDLSEMNRDAILFAEPNNPVDLADKVEAVLTDSALAERLARGGRAIIEQTLSTAKVAGRYEAVYRRMVE